MDSKILILLIFIFFAFVTAMIVGTGSSDLVSMFERNIKHNLPVLGSHKVQEIVTPTSHSYWTFYYNGEYYWTWVAVKSNKQLDNIQLVTSFPLLEPASIVQSGFDGEYYYYRVVLKTKREPNFGESFTLGKQTITVYPQVEDVSNTNSVEIVGVIVKDNEVLPSMIISASTYHLLNQLENGMIIFVQNTGQDFTFNGASIIIGGTTIPVQTAFTQDGEEIHTGDIIKSGDIIGIVVDNYRPSKMDSIKATVYTPEATIETTEIKLDVPEPPKQPFTWAGAPFIVYDYNRDVDYRAYDIMLSDSIILAGMQDCHDISGINFDYCGQVSSIKSDGTIDWVKLYNGNSGDSIQSVIQTQDGFLLAGYSYSFGGHREGWILKIAPNGDLMWSKTIGTDKNDFFDDVIEFNQGYLLIGYKTNPTSQYYYSGWITKIDSDGNIQWSKVIGGNRYDYFYGATTTDDGAIIVGYTSSYALQQYNYDGWAIKIDYNGNIQWAKVYTGSGSDIINEVIKDGEDFILIGYTQSYTSPCRIGGWVIKIDSSGNVLQSKKYCITGNNGTSVMFNSIIKLEDGYLILGEIESQQFQPNWHPFILKLDDNLEPQTPFITTTDVTSEVIPITLGAINTIDISPSELTVNDVTQQITVYNFDPSQIPTWTPQ